MPTCSRCGRECPEGQKGATAQLCGECRYKDTKLKHVALYAAGSFLFATGFLLFLSSVNPGKLKTVDPAWLVQYVILSHVGLLVTMLGVIVHLKARHDRRALEPPSA